MSVAGRGRCVLAALLLTGALAAAQGAQPTPAGPQATAGEGEDIVVRLVTIDPSRPIYTWWGHSALIVERRGQARFYNPPACGRP